MEALIGLSVETQIVLVSGYLAYKVFVTGRGADHRTEEFVLQVAAFGSLGRLATLVVYLLLQKQLPVLRADDPAGLVTTALSTAAGAIVVAGLWRRFGLVAASRLMKIIGLYRDDHEYSTLASIQNSGCVWTFIQAHLEDGRILESHFGKLPGNIPIGPMTLNSDGIAFYVTRSYDPNGVPRDYDIVGNDGDYPITYLPRDQVRQIEIGLRRR